MYDFYLFLTILVCLSCMNSPKDLQILCVHFFTNSQVMIYMFTTLNFIYYSRVI